MQAIFRSAKGRIFNGAAFCGGKYIRAFSIWEAGAGAGICFRWGVENRGTEMYVRNSGSSN